MVLRMLVVATCAHAWLLENSTFWRSPQREEPMWKRMLRTTSPRRRGVILWAHGRSATDTYCGTLKDSAHFRYCNGIKEGFNTQHREGRDLTRKNLERCARRNEMLSHVKPSHLSPEDKRDHLNTPEKFMRAARQFGYEVIVAEYRANALARMVSSWEMKPRSAADTKAQFCLPRGDLVRQFDEEYFLWQRGLRAAIHERLKVIEFSFENVTRGLCAAVKRTTLALESSKCGGSKCACREFESPHTKTSDRAASLAGRTSKEAAACITAALEDKPDYAWMLDLSRAEK